jgi:hypothetical protein
MACLSNVPSSFKKDLPMVFASTRKHDGLALSRADMPTPSLTLDIVAQKEGIEVEALKRPGFCRAMTSSICVSTVSSLSSLSLLYRAWHVPNGDGRRVRAKREGAYGWIGIGFGCRLSPC